MVLILSGTLINVFNRFFFQIQDISEIDLKDLQNERCSRISANDVIKMKNDRPDEIVVIDLRSHLEFNRAHLKDSINVPFASISLSDVRIEALNVPDLEARLTNRIVVIAGNSHENAILVRFHFVDICISLKKFTKIPLFQFAHFLLDCGTRKVCILHNGFNILHSYVPNVLETS